MSTIAERLAGVLERIERARARVAGAPVRLVAVSKHHEPEAIAEAHDAGQLDFGENYAQELAHKRTVLTDPTIRWHMIGPVQSNKAKSVVDCALVHTVDRASLLHALDRRAVDKGVTTPCLVQVNVVGEASKSGCSPTELPGLLDAFTGCAAARCVGLMLIAEPGPPAHLAEQFSQLAALRDRHGATTRARVELAELSMGMSDDFELAIAHGATIVRIGTAIFGPRTAASVVGRAGS